jgi:hypothetical protein
LGVKDKTKFLHWIGLKLSHGMVNEVPDIANFRRMQDFEVKDYFFAWSTSLRALMLGLAQVELKVDLVEPKLFKLCLGLEQLHSLTSRKVMPLSFMLQLNALRRTANASVLDTYSKGGGHD